MTSTKPKVAFAGLGAMGYGMASHLLKSGFDVIGYDVYQPAMERLVAEGGKSAPNPRDAARGVEFFICMVANSLQAEPLLFHPNTGAARALPQSATILMCSTVAPAYINGVRGYLHEIGRPDIRLIDSPVSGGTARAANGTLSIFSSGEDYDLANARSILECLSGKLYQIPGGLGGGSKAKMIHQVFAGINIAMASEAMGLVAAAGLNTREACDKLKRGEGGSWMFEYRVPHMLDTSLPPYSAVTIIAKDVGIITSTARDLKFPLPMTSTAEQLYLTAISAGWGKEDDCVLTRLYLPGRPDLVIQNAKASNATQPTDLTVDDIKDLMVGVHLAGMAEAMLFCEHLGIDTDLMYDIVSNAAGASAIFSKTFADMQKGNWELRSVSGAEEIRDRLTRAVAKAYELRYPLHLSSAALQEFHRQLR